MSALTMPSAVVAVAGVDYTVALPASLHADAPELTGEAFPAAFAPMMLAHLASALTWSRAQRDDKVFHSGYATWRTLAAVFTPDDCEAITERLGAVGDPLTLDLLEAGALEAVVALAAVTPRPAGDRSGPAIVVDIAGRPYRVYVPPGLLDMVMVRPGGSSVLDAIMPGTMLPGMMPLLLLDEATLVELDERTGDPGDPCDMAAILGALFGMLSDLRGGVPVEVELDGYLVDLDHAARSPAVPVILNVAGLDYTAAYPLHWVLYLEAAAGMGPLLARAAGVERAVQLEGLAVLVARAAPMILHPMAVTGLERRVADPGDRCTLVDVARALVRALPLLDAEYDHALEAAMAAAVFLAHDEGTRSDHEAELAAAVFLAHHEGDGVEGEVRE